MYTEPFLFSTRAHAHTHTHTIGEEDVETVERNQHRWPEYSWGRETPGNTKPRNKKTKGGVGSTHRKARGAVALWRGRSRDGL